jgi:hypothetical protein
VSAGIVTFEVNQVDQALNPRPWLDKQSAYLSGNKIGWGYLQQVEGSQSLGTAPWCWTIVSNPLEHLSEGSSSYPPIFLVSNTVLKRQDVKMSVLH